MFGENRIKRRLFFFPKYFVESCILEVFRKFMENDYEARHGFQTFFAPKENCRLIPFSTNFLKYTHILR